MAADIQPVLDTAAELEQVLDRETELLDQRGARAIGELQDEKNRLTNAYLRLTQEMLKNKPALSDDQRRQLREAHESLQATTQRNARLLEAARMANNRLIDLTADVVAQERDRHTTYTSHATAYGKQARGGKPAPRTGPVSLAVNVNA